MMLMRFLGRGLLCFGLAMLGACAPSAPESPPAASHSQTADAASLAPTQATLKGVNVRRDKIGGDFTLTGSDGKPFALNQLRGKVVILAFGFTNCPDVCPTELWTYREALRQLGEQAKNVAVVFVSVDPQRDTPDLVGRYVRQFHEDFVGLSDVKSGENVAQVKRQYRIVSAKTEVKSDTLYNIDHTSGAYLLDKKGQVAVFEPYGVESAQVAADVRVLLAEN